MRRYLEVLEELILLLGGEDVVDIGEPGVDKVKFSWREVICMHKGSVAGNKVGGDIFLSIKQFQLAEQLAQRRVLCVAGNLHKLGGFIIHSLLLHTYIQLRRR